jgi:hypothetical protein
MGGSTYSTGNLMMAKVTLVVLLWTGIRGKVWGENVFTSTLRTQKVVPVLHNLDVNMVETLASAFPNELTVSASLRHFGALQAVSELLSISRPPGFYVGASTVSNSSQVIDFILMLTLT